MSENDNIQKMQSLYATFGRGDIKLKENGREASTGSVHEFTLRDTVVIRFRSCEDTASVRDAWNG